MYFLDLTLPTPAENLALDEALLDEAESAGRPMETLRVWEPAMPMVVIGRSSDAAGEVRLEACRERGIPVLRRASGGAAVVAGPGCLMYSVVLGFQTRPALKSVERAHHFVLDTLVAALRPLVPGVTCQGTSDLALGDAKFSGNSVRVKRDHLLYHGTLLYDFPLELLDACLAMPPRQPGYRQNRPHGAFVTNLPVGAESLRRALVQAWQARSVYPRWPDARTSQLVADRYGRAEWNG